MGRPFFEFSKDESFRDNLYSEYILPVAHWFMRDLGDAYLLPQASGSNWECALAIEFLVGLARLDEAESSLADQIRVKTVNTARWLVDQVRDEGDGCASWDGAQWDTAVALRALLLVYDEYIDRFSRAEVAHILSIRDKVGKWLTTRVTSWASDMRYPAGPPDLAQVLSTLLALRARDRDAFRACEGAAGFSDDRSISEAVRLLMAMVDTERISAQEDEPKIVELPYWVDPFNTSEVIDALSQFVTTPASDFNSELKEYQHSVRNAVIDGLRYIECKQSEGTWGGVADTCGTLYGYLAVLERLAKLAEPLDPIVFKALRWICDGNQTMSDGSFLHSGYPTVYSALSMLKAYESWNLGTRGTAEVYDIALWLTPNVVSHERSRRLELELRNEDLSTRVHQLEERVARQHTNGITALIITMFAVMTVFIMSASIMNISLDLKIKDLSVFWAIIAVSVALGGMVVSAARSYSRRGGSRASRKC